MSRGAYRNGKISKSWGLKKGTGKYS